MWSYLNTKPSMTAEDRSKKKIWLWIEYIINILNAFVLTATIGVFAFKNLALAFPFMFPGNEFALPDWFAGSLYSPMCGVLAIMEGVTAFFALAQWINGLIILNHFKHRVDDASILKLELTSTFTTFLGSSAICVGASLIVFGVAAEVAFSVFIAAFAFMAMRSLIVYEAKQYLSKNKAIDKFKFAVTLGLYFCGMAALLVKVLAAAILTANIGFAMFGGLSLAVVFGLIAVVGLIVYGIHKARANNSKGSIAFAPMANIIISSDEVAAQDIKVEWCKDWWKIPHNLASADLQSVQPSLYSQLMQIKVDTEQLQNDAYLKQLIESITKPFAGFYLNQNTELLIYWINSSQLPQKMKDSLVKAINNVSDEASIKKCLSVLEKVLIDKKVIQVVSPENPQLDIVSLLR